MKILKMNQNSLRGVLALALMAAATLAAPAFAHDRGLGSHWPNSPDVSRSADFHAYRWTDVRGVAYVQINARDGQPLGAIAVGGGEVLVLPVGETPVAVQGASSTPVEGTVVYDDGAVSVSAESSGLVVRSLAVCKDPVECSKPMAASVSTTSAEAEVAPASTTTTATQQISPLSRMAAEPCKDPVECSKP